MGYIATSLASQFNQHIVLPSRLSILIEHTPASPWMGSTRNPAMRSPFSAIHQREKSNNKLQKISQVKAKYTNKK